jgi:hypothetical protein
MKVFRHLVAAYRSVYLWFWFVMALFVTAIVVAFQWIGPNMTKVMDSTIWQGGGQQAPRWFLFVIGIMLATMNLPVVIAHGITRRNYFAGVMIFTAVSAAAFTAAVILGFVAEQAGFEVAGVPYFLPEHYPLNSFGAAASYAGEAFLAMWGFMLSGWAIGLLFYRLRWWVAILLILVAGIPLGAFSLPPGVEVGRELATRMALGIGASAIVVLLSFLLIRSVPVKPKKA